MASFESLPIELVLRITETINEEHKPSLASLSVVSRGCQAATSEFLFQNVKVKLHRRPGDLDIWNWNKLLTNRVAFKHVRSLDVVECPIDRPNQEETSGLLEPLAKLIAKSTHLRVLRWRIRRGDISQPILDVIRNQLPHLDLHVKHRQNRPAYPRSEPFPIQVLQPVLPYLTSFSFEHHWLDDPEGTIRRRAFLRALGLGSPKLKTLRERKNHRPLYYTPKLYTAEVEISRKALSNTGSAPVKLDLDHYCFDGVGCFTDSNMYDSCAAYIDTSVIRKLELLEAMNNSSMERMAKSSFDSLEDLTITLDHSNSLDPTYAQAAKRFFTSLRSVLKLNMRGRFIPHTMNTAILHHGSTLKELSLTSVTPKIRPYRVISLGHEDLTFFKKHCPLLESLTCTVRRNYLYPSKELKLYEALAGFPHLQTANLTLRPPSNHDEESLSDSHPSRIIDEHHRGREEYLTALWAVKPRHDLRDAMINAAIDEVLVGSIWDAITQNTHRNQSPLKRLAISSQRDHCHVGITDSDYAEAVLNEFCSEWVAERNVRDDIKGIVIRGKKLEDESTELDKIEQDPAMEVFRLLWPQKSKYWREDWSSFPLGYTL